MRNVTLGDTRLYLRQLLADGGDLLRASETGRLYEPRIRAKKVAIDAVPEAAVSRMPFSDELGVEDGFHDGYGGAAYHLCEAILLHPKLSSEIKQTATMVRDTFIKSPLDLRRSYADEAATALANRPKLTKHKAALKVVQVPGGGSLFDWLKSFLDSGDAIDSLLRRRAETLATTEDASANGALRGATVGLLMRFRDALRDELADPDTKLPADYETRLFAYLDKLSADRAAAVARRAAGTGPSTEGVDGEEGEDRENKEANEKAGGAVAGEGAPPGGAGPTGGPVTG